MGLTKDDLRALLEAFEASTWQEMTVEIDGDRIHVSRREANGHHPAPVPDAPPPPAVEASPAVPTGPPPALTGEPVVSPSVGIFWRAPAPDAPPFVEVGSRVGPADTVGIIEVMKLMTPVAAGRSGTVSAVLVDNGQAVEHGEALVLILSD
jgi:acetyl-CoA carboxylase biotin carboxyl carrier protein